jgi:hypothetical protein
MDRVRVPPEYLNLLPAAAAVINGFIAVVIANFLRDRRRIRVSLVVTAGMLGASAIGATFYSQHLAIAQRAEERVWWGRVREQLGVFIAEGNDLMLQCRQDGGPAPEPAATNWGAHVEIYLRNVLRQSYVNRFRSDAGLPVIATNLFIPHFGLWRRIYFRVARLEQFSEELPHYLLVWFRPADANIVDFDLGGFWIGDRYVVRTEKFAYPVKLATALIIPILCHDEQSAQEPRNGVLDETLTDSFYDRHSSVWPS